MLERGESDGRPTNFHFVSHIVEPIEKQNNVATRENK